MSIAIDVTVRRGDFTLRVDTSVEPGSVVAILGPNGAGKTTLLRALAGLERIDDGSIVIDGVVVDGFAVEGGSGVYVPPQERSVGVVFQDYALFPHLTILENVAFGPRARGVGREQARRRAIEMLGRLKIEGLSNRKPREISGGQMQRVALARALAVEPSLLLLDEPLAALDVETRESVRVELEQQLSSYPGCALMVTHDPLDAMLLADRVLVVENGQVVQDGPPSEVAERPLTPYVAALMGVNLFRGVANDGELALDGGGVLHLANHDVSGRATAVVRPEAVTIHRALPEGSARNAWAGTVTMLQPLHDRVRVHVAGQPSVVATVTPAAISELRIAKGTPVWLSVKAVELSVFSTPFH